VSGANSCAPASSFSIQRLRATHGRSVQHYVAGTRRSHGPHGTSQCGRAGAGRTRPPLLNGAEAVRKKMEMLHVLGDIEIAQVCVCVCVCVCVRVRVPCADCDCGATVTSEAYLRGVPVTAILSCVNGFVNGSNGYPLLRQRL
jgi:hypothetical protein